MIRKFVDACAIATLFLGLSKLLQTFNFWGKIGLFEPQGFVSIGLLFIGLFVVLQLLVFDPFLKVLDERDEATTGTKSKALKTQEEARATLIGYRKSIDEAKLRATRERELALLKTEEAERTRLDEIKKDESDKSQKLHEQLKKDKTRALKELEASIEPLASDIVLQVLRGGTRSLRDTGAVSQPNEL